MLGGTFLAIMDAFIVNVAAPTIMQDLGTSFSELQLVIGAYLLVYGVLLVLGGRLGDLRGYRTLFLIGVAVFTVGSAACGFAPTATLLIVFRMAQAVGAAMFYPQVLSLMNTLFSGRRRAQAFGLFGATIGLASVAGQIVGGLLVTADVAGTSWRSIFLINVPLGLLILVSARRLIPRTSAVDGATRTPGLDLPGAALLAVGLAALLGPLVYGPEHDWPVWIVVTLACSPVLLAIYARWETAVSRRGGDPLIDPGLARNRAFAAGSVIAVAFFAGNSGLFLILTLFLQDGLDLPAMAAGLTFAPLAVAFAAAALLADRLGRLIGRHVLTVGYVVNIVGTVFLLVMASSADRPGIGTLVAPLIVIGFGQGFGVAPLISAVLEGVPPRYAGAASGALETVIQFGQALGVAVLGAALFVVLGERGLGAGPEAVSSGFAATVWVNLALAVLALLLLPLVFAGIRSARAAPGPPTDAVGSSTGHRVRPSAVSTARPSRGEHSNPPIISRTER